MRILGRIQLALDILSQSGLVFLVGQHSLFIHGLQHQTLTFQEGVVVHGGIGAAYQNDILIVRRYVFVIVSFSAAHISTDSSGSPPG